MNKTLPQLTSLAMGFALVTSALGAPAAGGSFVSGRTVKEEPFFAPGEEMVFEIEARGFENVDLKSCSLWWTRTGDDGLKESGRAPAAEKFVYRTSLGFPGFVRVVAELHDATGARVKGERTGCALGAGVDIDDIRTALPPPTDYVQFWEGRKAFLAKTPWKGLEEVVEIASPLDSVRLYKVKVPCAGKMPVTGYLSVPKASAKYPICTFYHGYGASFRPPATGTPTAATLKEHAKEIYFSMSAHGFELGRESKYYSDYRESLKSNGREHGFDPIQNADPLKPYYHDLALRVMRGLEYLKSRPEWNGRDIKVTGGSQGGLQSVMAAALDKDVTHVWAFIPWNCDIGGEAMGRDRGSWYVSWVPALGYYDTANFARMIPRSCKVDIHFAGLGDAICPPAGVASFYNALDCEKSIAWVQNAGHGDRHEPKPGIFWRQHKAGSTRWDLRNRLIFSDKRFGLAIDNEPGEAAVKTMEKSRALFVLREGAAVGAPGEPVAPCGAIWGHTIASLEGCGTGLVRDSLICCDGSACRVKTAEEVVASLARATAGGSNYVLKIELDGGQLDSRTTATLEAVGAWIDANTSSFQCNQATTERLSTDGAVMTCLYGCAKYVHFLDPKLKEVVFDSSDDFFEATTSVPGSSARLEKTATGWKVSLTRPAGYNFDIPVKLVPRLKNPFGWKGIRISVPPTGAVCERFCRFIEERLGPDGIDKLFLEVNYGYRYKSHPECCNTNALTEAELRRIVECCRKAGIEFTPIVNTLGHQTWRDIRMGAFLGAHPECDETPELKQVTDNYCRSFCPRHPTVRKIIPDLINEIREVTGAKEMHVGTDEVFELAKCPRCRGTSTGDIYAEWVNFLNASFKAHGGERLYVWADRLIPYDEGRFGETFYGESANGTETALGKVDKDVVLCDWHYSWKPEYRSADLFRVAGYKQVVCPWCEVAAAKKFVEYAAAHGRESVVGLMLTTWNSCADVMDAIEGRRKIGGDGVKPVSQDCWGSGEVYRAFANPRK